MGQFDKNSGVISLFRSLINLNQGSFTFKNDEFQFYIHKNDEFHENVLKDKDKSSEKHFGSSFLAILPHMIYIASEGTKYEMLL